MSAHTKGPWWIRREYSTLYVEGKAWDPRVVQEVAAVGPKEGGAEQQVADALLIHAAPELLSSVEALLELFQKAVSSGDWVLDGACDPDAAINRARAAIAKATQP